MPTPDLPHRFTYHPPHGNQPDRYQAIRLKALELAKQIDAIAREG